MKILLLLLVGIATFVSSLSAKSQNTGDTICIHGFVRNTGGETVETGIISIRNPEDSVILGYSMTDDKGHYIIKTVTCLNKLLVKVDGFNIKQQIKTVEACSQQLDFTVEDESMILREVQIKARKLWGNRDTLNYLVSAYTKEHDRTIGDILKQLPGITIDDSGTIKYQGVPINHFYIENLDLLQGRYSLATQGIKAEDVATVQVLENHEHVKALQDQDPPESAAINLKLKNKSKGLWTRNMYIGMGTYGKGLLWDVSLQAMYFGNERQHMLRYGGDNMGRGVDMSSAHYGQLSDETIKMLGVVGHGFSPIGNSTFGNAHSVNLNNLSKLSDDVTLHYNMNYKHALSYGSSYSSTTYIMPDGTDILLTEDLSDRMMTDRADLQLTYEKNSERRFLNNTFSFSGKWDKDRGSVISNTEEILQRVHYHSLSMSNSTHWVNRTEKGGGFTYKSTNRLSYSPQSLTVGGAMQALQDVEITSLSTSNDFEMLNNLRVHRWTLAPSVQVNADYTMLSSLLHHSNVQTANQGDMEYLRLSVGIGPVARYVKGNFRSTLRLPLSVDCINLDNACIEGEQTDVKRIRLRLRPSFSLLWKATNYFTFESGANYSTSATSWPQLLTAYIMNNYRSLSRYNAAISDSYGAGAYLKVLFKDVFNGWFAHVNASWNSSWSDWTYGTVLDSLGHSIIETCNTPNKNRIFTLTGYVRKDIDWKTLQMELTATGSHGHGDILRQSVLTDNRTENYALQGKIGMDILPGYRIDYKADWNYFRSRSTNYVDTYSELLQMFNLNMRLVKSRLYLNIAATHIHNNRLVSDRKDYVLVNAGLQIKVSKKFEINIKGDNLTNMHSFISRSNDNMEIYYSEYHLRPWSMILSTHITL